MSSIDERVVEMKFENDQFQSGVQGTVDALDTLKSSLDLTNEADNLNNLQAVGDSFDLSNIADGVSAIADKFSALSVIATTALATIASKAVDAGVELAKSFTTDLIGEGFQNYETQINAVQTIMANTSGTSLKTVSAALQELNVYANQTVYNFSDMAKNIGTFTAAGVNLKTSVSSIKGIANLAALSGSNAQQASGAMYQLSQAIAQGKVRLQDWNSVVTAGLGGKVFQQALITTARAHGVAVDKMIKDEGGFRASLAKNWLTSKILTDTLKGFTGDLGKAQLKQMGYSDQQAAHILKVGKNAVDAATQVKTVTQLASALREEVGTAYAAVFKTIFGNINQAKGIFSPLHTEIENDLTIPIYKFNDALSLWSNLGGRTDIIKAFTTAFKFLRQVMAPIGKALQDTFPDNFAQSLIDISRAILTFTQGLKLTGSASNDIYRTFKGVFAIFDIGRQILFGLVKMIGNLFGQFSGGTGSVLDITAAIGDFLVKVDKAIKSGDGLNKFFETLGKIVAVPIGFIMTLVGLIGQLVSHLSGFKSAAFGTEFDKMGKALSPFNAGLDLVQRSFGRVSVAATAVYKFLKPVITAIGDFFAHAGTDISSGVNNINWDNVLSGVQSGFFAALTVLVGKFIRGGKSEGGGGILGALGIKELLAPLTEIFDALTGALQAMQQNLKANVLLKIAGAIGLMTVSVVALSLIDSKRLAASMGAITVMMGELGLAMKLFSSLNVAGGLKGTTAIAGMMITMAIAIDILANAVSKLAKLDWNQLARGLTGLLIIMAAVISTSKILGSGEQANLMKFGIAMIPFALGLDLMAAALKIMAGLSWNEMAKGLTGFGATLGGFIIISQVSNKINAVGMLKAVGAIAIMAGAILIMATSLKIMSTVDPGSALTGMATIVGAIVVMSAALKLIPEGVSLRSAAALIVMAAAIDLLAIGLKSMGDMSMGGVGKALLLLAGSLAILTATLILMGDPIVLLGAASLVVAAAALLILAPALKAMGDLSMDEIGKALGVLAASLIIIALSLTAMIVALPGAAALLVAAAALAILAPVLAILGSLPIQTIGMALFALVGVFVALTAGAIIVAVAIPILLALGGAILLLGAGVALAGIGIVSLAQGLVLLGVAGGAGVAALAIAIDQFLQSIPSMATDFTTALTSMADAIGNAAPSMVDAFAQLLLAMLSAVDRVGPKLISTATDLISAFIGAIGKLLPRLYDTGLSILLAMIRSLGDHIGKIVDAATRVVVNFIDGIGRGLPKVIDAGIRMIINFVNGLADGIRKHTKEMHAAGVNLAQAIIDGMTSGLTIGLDALIGAATNIASGVLNTVKVLLGIHSPSKEFEKLGVFVNEGFIQGLTGYSLDNVQKVFGNYSDMVAALLSSSAQSITDYQDKIKNLSGKISNDTDAITKQQAAVNKAKADRSAGTAVNQDIVRLGQLTAARARDEAQIKKYQAASTASYKKDGDAKRAQAKLDLQSAKASLAANKQSIAETKATLNKDKADIKHGTTVAAAQKKLDALIASRKDDNAALTAARDALAAAQTENDQATASQTLLNSSLADSEATLEQNANNYDILTDKIKTESDALKTATDLRDNYNQSVHDSYDALTAVSNNTDINQYFKDLEDQVTKVNTYAADLQELRNRGLNDAYYKKFISDGIVDLPFVDQLLNAGGDGIAALNSLSDQLDQAATNLGNVTSTNLYQAGVDSAQGLLDGYNSQQAALKDTMDTLANSMLDAVKKALGIASPSKEFAKLGVFSVDGLAQGLTNSTKNATDAATQVADASLAALQSSLGGISDAVANEMDLQPTIKPVLDLSGVTDTAGQLGGILGAPTLSLGTAYNSANVAATGLDANQQAIVAAKTEVASTSTGGITYNQFNNSPKALSNGEIYRQTKNQLSRIKEG